MTRNDVGSEGSEIDYAAAADQAYEEGKNFDTLEPIEVEVDPQVRSVVSVRFNRGELSSVEAASRAAGVPLSTFIRNAALQASGRTEPLSAADVRETISSMQKAMDLLNRSIPS